MRTISSGNIIATCFDEFCYLRQKNVINIRVTTQDTTFNGRVTLVIADAIPDVGGTGAAYVLADGECNIDLSEIIKIGYSRGVVRSFVTISTNIGDEVVIDWEVFGQIEPQTMSHPYHIGALPFTPFGGGRFPAVVIPPSIMLAPISGDIMSVIYARVNGVVEMPDGVEVGYGDRTISTAFNTNKKSITSDGAPIWTANIMPLMCGVNYVTLRWIDSIRGFSRSHTFVASGISRESGDIIDIMRIDNQFDVRKESALSFTARLDNLNRYDFEYYADVILSNHVEASFNGTEFVRVNVATESATALDGDAELQNLEVNVIYRRYDY